MNTNTFNVFVYGTLMKGFRAGSFIPEKAIRVRGRIIGNLYHYSGGYPIAQIPDTFKTIRGSGDYLQDLENQREKEGILKELPFDFTYGNIYGELCKIPVDSYLNEIVKWLDSYEGFRPESGNNLYNRNLVPVETDSKIEWAWIYNMNVLPEVCVRVFSGNWADCFNKEKLPFLILKQEIRSLINQRLLLLDEDDPLPEDDEDDPLPEDDED